MVSQISNPTINKSSPPLVSAIMAVRNEERYIERALTSLLQQKTSGWDIEVIVVDGNSIDTTGEIVRRIAREDPRVKLASNMHGKTPYAFNIGIEKSRGEYVCILGAHNRYAENYIATCLEELELHSAAGCSGKVITRPGGDSLQAHLVAWTLAHPFGSSSGSMRTRSAGFADSIPYPLFRKSTLLNIGVYNTVLHRNQDNDLNQRLRARGHKLYITDKTFCEYFVISDLRSLARYAFKSGYWNIISFKVNPESMSLRHFIPGAFVLVLILNLIMVGYSIVTHTHPWMATPFILLVTVYVLVSIVASCHTACRVLSLGPLLMPIPLFLLHVFYGAGNLAAIVGNARSPSD